jgi:hypothetical protein
MSKYMITTIVHTKKMGRSIAVGGMLTIARPYANRTAVNDSNSAGDRELIVSLIFFLLERFVMGF